MTKRINDLPDEILIQIMVYSGTDLSLLKSICRRWFEIIKNNQVLLIHFKLASDNKPSMARIFQENYHLINASSKQQFLRDNKLFMKKYLNFGMPDLYISSIFDTFMSNMVFIVKEIEFNSLKTRLTKKLAKRPTKQELVKSGILKSFSNNVQEKIKLFKKLLIEENLKMVVNSYNKRCCRRVNPGGVETSRPLIRGGHNNSATVNGIRNIIAIFNNEYKDEVVTARTNIQKKHVVTKHDELCSWKSAITVKDQRLFFESQQKKQVKC